MNMKHVMVVAAALLAVLCVLPAADAAQIQNTPGDISIDDNQTAVIRFDVYSDSGFEMTVTVRENGNTVSEQTVQVQPGRTTNVEISLNGLSVGTHQYRVECTGDSFTGSNGFNVTVNVDQSLLSNWITYAAIAVVVIVIVIFAYIKMRDTPKAKPEMTFEELEAQRKAEMAEKAENKQKKSSSSSTERRRFEGRKKEADAPAEKPRKKEEAPKMTFEELEAQKQAEKAAKAEKKQKSTGLTERERYLEEKRKKKEE